MAFYKNPILYADYSDPDVIRVGEDFYMVSSSFTYLPGVPLLHSKDLVNWEIINHCVKKLPFERYQKPMHGAGTWAPSIRYHKEWYYVFVPLPDEGIFVTKTQNPYGEWSDLYCLKKAKGWIDPCPFWDSDGNAYMIHAFAYSRCGIKHQLNLCKMNEDATALLDDGVIIYDGRQTNPTIEGPKLYKKGEYYYIFAPAGGVETGWQTVLRSKTIYGPYEEKIVLHQGNTLINGPHQGGYVEIDDKESYFIHFQDADAYGRIVHMQPMCWRDGWPFIGKEQNGDGIGEPVDTWEKPNLSPDKKQLESRTNDEFDSNILGLQWQWQANPKNEWYSLNKKKSCIRLFSKKNNTRRENLLWYVPNLMTQMIQGPCFTADTVIQLEQATNNDKAGIVILGHEYVSICIKRKDADYRVEVTKGIVLEKQNEGKAEEKTIFSLKVETNQVYFKVDFREGGKYFFSYSLDNKEFIKIEEEFQATRGTWTGAKVALFCINEDNGKSKGYCDIDYIRFNF